MIFSVFSQCFQISKSVKIEASSQNYFEEILQAQILTLSKSERCLTNLFFCNIIFNIIHSAGYPTSENNLWTIILLYRTFWWHHLASKIMKTRKYCDWMESIIMDEFMTQTLTRDKLDGHSVGPFWTQNFPNPKHSIESDPWRISFLRGRSLIFPPKFFTSKK